MVKHIKSTIAALLLVAAGFLGGSLLMDGAAGETLQRPFFTDNQVTVSQQQPANQTIALDQQPDTTLDSVAQQVSPTLVTEDERIMADVYNRVSPSVVAINVFQTITSSRFGSGEVASSGSGFVIDEKGHIVTNYHVVNRADEIIVNFLDGTIVRAEVVGLDADSDLAVLKVDLPAERLMPVRFGSEKDLVIGQHVLAIGSPFQQRWTMTSGIVSALDRDINSLGNYRVGSVIQTDAPINPGNSGGPLLNLLGEVVGVNAQIVSETGANSGIGFAIPATLVQRVTRDLIVDGTVDYSFIGITTGDMTLEIIEQYGLANNQRGIPIGTVLAGSPAARAGLRSSTDSSVDIIVAIDGIPVNSFASLIGYLAEKTRPGDTIMTTVLRNGQTLEVPLTLVSRANN